MSGGRRLGRARLGAYLDGELDQRRRREVEVRLARVADDAARMGALRRLDRALQVGASAIGDASRVAAPTLLRLYRTRRRRRRWLGMAVAAVLTMAAVGTWLTELEPRPVADLTGLARDADAAYRVRVVATDGVPKQPDDAARLLAHLGRPIPVPDLAPWGFRLTAAVLLATERGPAVQLAYADPGGRRVSCLFRLRPANTDADLTYREADGVVTAVGADRDLGYAMSARLPRRELASIAGEVYGRDDP